MKFKIKFTAVAFCVLEFLCIFLITAYSIQENIPPEVLNFENGIKAFIQFGKNALFLSNTSKLTVEEFKTFEFSSENVLVGFGYGIMLCFFLMGYNFYIAFCLTAVATLWLAVKDFYEKSFRSMDLYWSQVTRGLDDKHTFAILKKNAGKSRVDDSEQFVLLLERYTKVKNLASKINEALGELFLIHTFAICFNYATNFDRIFSAKGWENKTIMYYFLVKNGAFLILSADICQKVTVLQNNARTMPAFVNSVLVVYFADE